MFKKLVYWKQKITKDNIPSNNSQEKKQQIRQLRTIFGVSDTFL